MIVLYIYINNNNGRLMETTIPLTPEVKEYKLIGTRQLVHFTPVKD